MSRSLRKLLHSDMEAVPSFQWNSILDGSRNNHSKQCLFQWSLCWPSAGKSSPFITKLSSLPSVGSHVLLMIFNWFLTSCYILKIWFAKTDWINILGLIYMLKMTAEGSNVDAVNWVARYTLVGKTADPHHTYCSPFNPTWPSKQLCKIAKWFTDMKINCAP